MHVASLGQSDPFYGVPMGVTNPLVEARSWAVLPPLQLAPGITESGGGTESTQFCLLGQLSTDPLIPGVCNTTALTASAALLGLILVMNR